VRRAPPAARSRRPCRSRSRAPACQAAAQRRRREARGVETRVQGSVRACPRRSGAGPTRGAASEQVSSWLEPLAYGACHRGGASRSVKASGSTKCCTGRPSISPITPEAVSSGASAASISLARCPSATATCARIRRKKSRKRRPSSMRRSNITRPTAAHASKSRVASTASRSNRSSGLPSGCATASKIFLREDLARQIAHERGFVRVVVVEARAGHARSLATCAKPRSANAAFGEHPPGRSTDRAALVLRFLPILMVLSKEAGRASRLAPRPSAPAARS